MNRKLVRVVAVLTMAVIQNVHAEVPPSDVDVRLNVTVSSTGNLRNDGKGVYRTGEDFVAAWLNPSRWPDMAFDICMNWPFARYPGIGNSTVPSASGIHDNRTLVHRITDPVAGPNGIGVFTGPGGGNDIALPKPLTANVPTLTDMTIGTSLSPRSAEVRFCNAHCTKVTADFRRKERVRLPRGAWCWNAHNRAAVESNTRRVADAKNAGRHNGRRPLLLRGTTQY